jgi:hypothetical protein
METMDTYVANICKLENNLSGLEIIHVVQGNNVGADMLLKDRLSSSKCPTRSFHLGITSPVYHTTRFNDHQPWSHGTYSRGHDDRG